LRIVLDTNVALSALLWRGKPYLLLEAILQRNDIQLFSSARLVAELADVLTRSAPAKKLNQTGETATQILSNYVGFVELVQPVAVPRVVLTDADDDHVIAAAVAARATLIVSGDSDQRDLRQYRGIDILSAAMALEQISGGAKSLS
jgi:uncharacterized protein